MSYEGRMVRSGVVAADTGSSRLVYAMVLALVLVGVALIVLAVVMIRRTRVDPEVLAPLERMGDRKWRKSDAESRRTLLDAVRPAGAVAMASTEPETAVGDLPPPSVVEAAAPAEPVEAPAEPVEAPAEPVEAPAEPVEAPAEPDATSDEPIDDSLAGQ